MHPVLTRPTRLGAPSDAVRPAPSMVDSSLLERQFDRVRPSTDEPVPGTSGRSGARSCATGAAAGSGPPRRRPAVRSRTPHGRRPRPQGRRGRYTTGAPGGTAHHHDRGGRRRHDLESNRSSRQAGATLGAASLEHGTATARAHAGAEAVRLGTTAGIWLKGTLHGDLRLLGDTRRTTGVRSTVDLTDAPQIQLPRLRRRRVISQPGRTNHSGVSCPQLPSRRHRPCTIRRFRPRFPGGDRTCYVRTLVSCPSDVPTLWTTMWINACETGPEPIGDPGE